MSERGGGDYRGRGRGGSGRGWGQNSAPRGFHDEVGNGQGYRGRGRGRGTSDDAGGPGNQGFQRGRGRGWGPGGGYRGQSSPAEGGPRIDDDAASVSSTHPTQFNYPAGQDAGQGYRGGRGRGRGSSDDAGGPGNQGFQRGRGRGWGPGGGYRGQSSQAEGVPPTDDDAVSVSSTYSNQFSSPAGSATGQNAWGASRGAGRGRGTGGGFRGEHGSDRPPYRGRGSNRGWGQAGSGSDLLFQSDGAKPTSPIPDISALSISAEEDPVPSDPSVLTGTVAPEEVPAVSGAPATAGGKGRKKKKPAAQPSSAANQSAPAESTTTPDIVISSNPPDSGDITETGSVSAAATGERSETADVAVLDVPSGTGEGPSTGGKNRKKKNKSSNQGASSNLTVTSSVKRGSEFVGQHVMPRRPDEGGKLGVPVEIYVNCWDIDLTPKEVHVYCLEAISVARVDASGNRRDLKLRAADLRAKLRHVVETMPEHSVYDGAHALYTSAKLPGITSEGLIKELEIPDPLDSGSLFLKYRILSVQTIGTNDLIEYVTNGNASTLNMPQDSIRCIDCVFKCACRGKFENLGRNALFEKKPAKVNMMLSIHRGFLTSVRPQWKIRANVDMVFKAFLTAGSMSDVLYEKYGDDMTQCIRQMEQDVLRIRVETNLLYKQKTGRVKRITVHGLSQKPASELMIPELKQSVASYFEEKYGIKLQYPELPCIKAKADKEEYFPMELLNILPFQAPKASKADVASQVIRLAAVQPRDRFQELYTFLNDMLASGNTLFNKFGVKVSRNSVKVTGRILPPPQANFGRGNDNIGPGKWNVPQFKSAGCKGNEIKWVLYSIPAHPRGNQSRSVVVSELPREAFKLGLKMRLIEENGLPIGELERRLRGLQVDLVVLVLHDDMSYAEIKRLGDLRLGIRTQCVRESTLRKPRVMPNLLLKINGKLGGVNWTIPELHYDGEHFMVFGADVTHPGPTQSHDLPMSVAAVTGSITPDLMRYAAVVRQQRTRRPGDKAIQETINEMTAFMMELLRCYYRLNNRFPSKLMFYRDGVSEGQFGTLLNTELPAIQRACAELRPGYEPGITYIVVQKRHHLRFMPEKPRQGNRSGNVEPGTVVDKDVTHRLEFDFYLSSAEGIQGTSKPAHYHVLYDDSDWSSDALQKFTYYLCHAYMRCSRSVSYPAPTYYSHLAAYRAREWLTRVRNPESLVRDNRFDVHESQVAGMFYL